MPPSFENICFNRCPFTHRNTLCVLNSRKRYSNQEFSSSQSAGIQISYHLIHCFLTKWAFIHLFIYSISYSIPYYDRKLDIWYEMIRNWLYVMKLIIFYYRIWSYSLLMMTMPQYYYYQIHINLMSLYFKPGVLLSQIFYQILLSCELDRFDIDNCLSFRKQIKE